MDRLKTFMSQVEGKACEWGRDDCTMLAAQWVQAETGLRPRTENYRSQKEAQRLIVEKGGLDQIWEASLDGILYPQIGEPQTGDVGLINTRKHGLIGVIFVLHGIAVMRTDEGYNFITPRKQTIHQVWALPSA